MSRKPVTISLPQELVRETNRFCTKRSVTLSEIARNALREYMYRQKMEEARQVFTAHVEEMGIHSEKDLLRAIQS